MPSVSEILGSTVFKGKYDGVDMDVLKAAAKWGTEVHYAIETDDVSNLDDLQFQKYDEYLGLVLKNKIQVLEHEMIVYYEIDGKVKYIGTLDMLVKWKGLDLGDVKTTYVLDKNYLSYQLTMYAMAYEQMNNKKIDNLFGMWLPKREKGKLSDIKRLPDDVIWEVLIDYEQDNL